MANILQDLGTKVGGEFKAHRIRIEALENATETVTSLSLTGDNLQYTDEAGVVETINLATYLDNTNLGRVVSGAVDGLGVMTLTRDDASTIAVDLSTLLDDTVLTKTDIDAMGVDAGTVNGKTVATSVPAGAVFTDTETTTALSLVGNTLTYQDEDGVVTSIDLSFYLDDTNLSKIITGTLSPSGIATFTRDDASSFTVDFSQFFDDTNLARITSGSTSGSDITLVRDDASTVTIDASAIIATAVADADASAATSYIPQGGLKTVNGEVLEGTGDIEVVGSEHYDSEAEPTTPSVGATWYVPSTGVLYKYVNDGVSDVWIGISTAGSSVNGTSERQTYVATSGQTTFNATYDAGYVDVYLNGIKLVPTTDFTATNGTTVVLTSGATTGDDVEIVAYGTFELADTYTQAQADALLNAKANVADVPNGANSAITDNGTNVGINGVMSSGKLGTSGQYGIKFNPNTAGQSVWWAENYSSHLAFGASGTIGNNEQIRFHQTGGITFNGDTSTANALDDYEEGTWTPILNIGTATGHTYSHQDGVYTKVGNMVYCQFSISITAKDATSGNALKITGFPYVASAGNAQPACSLGRTYGITLTSPYNFALRGDINITTMTFFRHSNGSWDHVQNSEIGSSMYMRGSISYKI